MRTSTASSPLVIVFIVLWLLIIYGAYMGYKYKQSRNKQLFFQNGKYLAFLWSLVLLVGAGGLIAWFLPAQPLGGPIGQLHSELVTRQLQDQDPLTRYFYLSIAVFSELNLVGLLFAALITALWGYFVRGLDFFHKEKLSVTALVFLAGCITTFLTFPLSDLVHALFQVEYSDNMVYNLFVYHVVGIGIVEETIKLLPLLLVLGLTRNIEEPLDMLYYACMAALGFAFIENLLYFRDLTGSIVIGRALLSALGHMVFASVAAYGILLYKFKAARPTAWVVGYYFLLGAFLHGLYDYLLLEELTGLFLLAFPFLVQAWAIMLNNCINNSPHFSYKIIYAHDQTKFRLALGIAGLLLLSFVVNGLLVGQQEAIAVYVSTLVWAGILMAFYVSTLSSFDLLQGYWRPVRFTFSPNPHALPLQKGASGLTNILVENVIVPLNHVGKHIKLHCPSFNVQLRDILPITQGYLEDRVKLEHATGQVELDWFLVSLTSPLAITDAYEHSQVILKLRDKSACLVHDTHVECL